jgi:hypothetical protein
MNGAHSWRGYATGKLSPIHRWAIHECRPLPKNEGILNPPVLYFPLPLKFTLVSGPEKGHILELS